RIFYTSGFFAWHRNTAFLDATKRLGVKDSSARLGPFMTSTTRRDPKKSKAKPRRPIAKKSQPKQARNIQSLQRALDESLAREAATSDILRMIARSPANLQSLLDGIAERAARLCDAENAAIFRVDDNFLHITAHFGPIPMAYPLGARVID